MTKPGMITQREAIERVCAQIEEPMALEAFVDRVLAIWPSKAKNPRENIRQGIKDDHRGKNLLFLDEETLMPLRLAMCGVCFRIPLSRQEVERGWLFAFRAFQVMHKPGLQPDDFRFEEVNGGEIPANPITVNYKEKTIFGLETLEKTAFDLEEWYQKQKLRRKDNLLATILDWETGRFQLRPEPARQHKKHLSEIRERNQAFADQVFAILEEERYESIWAGIAVPTAYLSLKDRLAYPADQWLDIIDKDPRMEWNGYDIRYADWRSPWDAIFEQQVPQSLVEPQPLFGRQARQVYRFKAYLWHRKGIWRRIEIQAGQTLAEFDTILRDAFSHEHFDHLSGFWKLVRRGNTRRFREVDLGSINPYEGGEAAEVRIADLEMEPGQALKYVYDFGDWIEHRIELEAIGDQELEIEYPRIVGQNKPRYRYCDECQEAGKQSVARWVCITCSNWEAREVLLCEDCLDSHEEDHYVEEMLY